MPPPGDNDRSSQFGSQWLEPDPPINPPAANSYRRQQEDAAMEEWAERMQKAAEQLGDQLITGQQANDIVAGTMGLDPARFTRYMELSQKVNRSGDEADEHERLEKEILNSIQQSLRPDDADATAGLARQGRSPAPPTQGPSSPTPPDDPSESVDVNVFDDDDRADRHRRRERYRQRSPDVAASHAALGNPSHTVGGRNSERWPVAGNAETTFVPSDSPGASNPDPSATADFDQRWENSSEPSQGPPGSPPNPPPGGPPGSPPNPPPGGPPGSPPNPPPGNNPPPSPFDAGGGRTDLLLALILRLMEEQARREESRDQAGYYTQGFGGQTDYARDRQNYEAEVLRRQRIDLNEARGDAVFEMGLPGGGSGKNLGVFGRRLYGIYQKVRGVLRPNIQPPNPKDYDKSGKYIGKAGRRSRRTTDRTTTPPTEAEATANAGRTGTATGTAPTPTPPVGPTDSTTVTPPEPTPQPGTERNPFDFDPEPAPPSPQSKNSPAKAGTAAAGETAMGGTAGEVMGKVGVAAVFAAAVVDFGKAVYEFATAQEQEVRKLAEYGASQAAGIAELDANRVMRDFDRAQQTGESSLEYTSAMDRFEDALHPIETLLTSLANTTAARVLDILTGMLEAVKPLTDLLEELTGLLGGGSSKPQTNWGMLENHVKDLEKRGEIRRWPGAGGS